MSRNPLQLTEVAMRLAGAAVEVSADAGLHRISRRCVAVASHAKRHRPRQRARALTHEAKLRRPTLRQPTLRLRDTTNNLPAAPTGRPRLLCQRISRSEPQRAPLAF